MKPEKSIILLPAILLTTLFIYWLSYLQNLYWFGDELYLLHQWKTNGWLTWLVMPFGEGICPVFKIIWSALVKLSAGNYLVMIAALWLVHLLLVVTLGRVLLLIDSPLIFILIAQAWFGLAWTNIEVLSVSYHINSSLCLLGFLFALHGTLQMLVGKQPNHGYVISGLALSLFSFQRGVLLTAAIIFCWVILALKKPEHRKSLFIWIAFGIFATILMTSEIVSHSIAQRPTPVAALHGTTLFFLTHPFSILLGFRSTPASGFLVSAALKLLIYFMAFLSAKRIGYKGLFLIGVVGIYDLLNSLALSLGRPDQLMALRYQPSFLLPMAVAISFALWGMYSRSRVFSYAVLILFAFSSAYKWQAHMTARAEWQGKFARKVLNQANLNESAEIKIRTWPGLPPMLSIDEARAAMGSFFVAKS